MCDFPVSDSSWIDADRDEQMDIAQHIVFMGRACRNTAAVKNRQPLSKIYVVAPKTLSDEYADIIKEELNIRELVYLSDAAELMDYRFKPQLRTLGKKLGAKLQAAKELIANLPGRETMNTLREKGSVTITVDGEDIILETEDLLVENIQPEGLSTQADRDYTVSLDTALTDELIEDGFVREVVSKVQTQRKESGFEVTDRIRLCYTGNDRIARIIASNRDFIADEVLAFEIKEGEGSNPREWDVNGEICVFSVEQTGAGGIL
jgi:isoleucyl-tRNA synthetase